MLKKLQDRVAHRDDAGFTLIELLIVIVILGILSAIVVFSVSGITDNGKASACKSDVSTINTAAEAYYAQHNGPVTNLAGLVTANLLHADAGISGNTKTVTGTNGYTVTFTPGTTTAGDAASTSCP